MGDPGKLARSYLVVHLPHEASGRAVADLLEAGAARLRRRGETTVHHLAFDTVDDVGRAEISLTIYCDPVDDDGRS